MARSWLTVLLLVTTSYSIEDIPKAYVSSKPLKSLLCNTCSILTSIVNETLHDSTKEFETLVGFRLDSHGKKIRKQSEWLKLYLSLEDVCEDWKDKYRVAKRKDGTLYLLEEDEISSIRRVESKKKRKLEDEIAERLNAKWAAEWVIEREEKQRIYNETHDDEGNLIETESDNIENQENSEVDIALSSNTSNTTTSDEEVIGKRYFYERKPKLVKKKDKPSKLMKDMCFFLSERFDEWLHAQSKTLQLAEGDLLKDYLKVIDFCLEDGLCKQTMFERDTKIFKFKKDLKIPKKPTRTFVPVQEQIQEDYEEEMEEDLEDEFDEFGPDGTLQENQDADQSSTENQMEEDHAQEEKSEL